MSLVWLELLELMKGRSGVALTQFSSSSCKHRVCMYYRLCVREPRVPADKHPTSSTMVRLCHGPGGGGEGGGKGGRGGMAGARAMVRWYDRVPDDMSPVALVSVCVDLGIVTHLCHVDLCSHMPAHQPRPAACIAGVSSTETAGGAANWCTLVCRATLRGGRQQLARKHRVCMQHKAQHDIAQHNNSTVICAL